MRAKSLLISEHRGQTGQRSLLHERGTERGMNFSHYCSHRTNIWSLRTEDPWCSWDVSRTAWLQLICRIYNLIAVVQALHIHSWVVTSAAYLRLKIVGQTLRLSWSSDRRSKYFADILNPRNRWKTTLLAHSMALRKAYFVLDALNKSNKKRIKSYQSVQSRPNCAKLMIGCLPVQGRCCSDTLTKIILLSCCRYKLIEWNRDAMTASMTFSIEELTASKDL